MFLDRGDVELGEAGPGVGEGEWDWGDRSVMGEGRGNWILYAVDTSWDAVDTRCLAGQVNYKIDLQF